MTSRENCRDAPREEQHPELNNTGWASASFPVRFLSEVLALRHRSFMSHIHVERREDAGELADALADAERIALDCEAAGFHRYSDRLCLVQITIDGATWTIDPLAFDLTELLRDALESADLPIVMHGADFDLRLLSRDLGIRVRGLQDTQISVSYTHLTLPTKA